MTVRFYSSTAEPTTLALNATAGTTAIEVVSLVGYPSSFPYTLCLDFDTSLRELVEVTNASGTTLTVTRGVDGTPAVGHSAGATVRHVSSARDYADSRAHENANMGVHGVAGAVVGTTDAQTLSNKILSGSIIEMSTFEDIEVSPSAPGEVALRVVADPAQSVNILEVVDKSGDTRHFVDENGGLQSVAESGVPAHRMNTAVGTPAGESLFEGYNASGNLVLFIGNGGAYEARPRGAENGMLVMTPASYTGNAFVYDLNGDVKFIVSNDGSISTDGSLTVTGNINSAANLDMNAWDSYVPTFTASVNPNIGTTGTIVGRTQRVGKMRTDNIIITFGGTGISSGTGDYVFSTASTMRTVHSVGGTLYFFNSGGADGSGIILSNSTTSVRAVGPGGSGTWNSATATFTAGDVLSLMITYEEA